MKGSGLLIKRMQGLDLKFSGEDIKKAFISEGFPVTQMSVMLSFDTCS